MEVWRYVACVITVLCSRTDGYPKQLQRDPPVLVPVKSFDRKAVVILSTTSAVHTQAARSNPTDDWRSTLFGENGILTALFRMMDQQRKIAAASRGSEFYRINDMNNFDLKEIFNIILKEDDRGDFVDSKSELSKFFGLCNKLSCGEIYKSIDKFRRSELFTNFQTALSLIQDPSGWETLGNLLSNPELISQFVTQTGMEELMGSAVGDKKKLEKRKEIKSNLMPEDGDFGIEFIDSDEENITKIEKKKEELPEIDFSVDGKGNEDYYGQGRRCSPKLVSEIIDETTLSITRSTAATTTATTTTEPVSMEISFSIDRDDGEEGEAVQVPSPLVAPQEMFLATTSQPISTKSLFFFTTQGLSSTRSTLSTTPRTMTTPTATLKLLTQTLRNHRKDSDYYAMYYDEHQS